MRKCIKQALAIGGMLELIKDPAVDAALVKEIENDSQKFQKTLGPTVDITREPSTVMPWGWRYADEEVQKKFREFCVNKA